MVTDARSWRLAAAPVVLASLVLTACFGREAAAPAAPDRKDWRSAHVGLSAYEGTIRGRITRDGEPVSYFGVLFVPHEQRQMLLDARATAVHAPNGQFVLHVAPGTWDVMIAGQGLRHASFTTFKSARVGSPCWGTSRSRAATRSRVSSRTRRVSLSTGRS